MNLPPIDYLERAKGHLDAALFLSAIPPKANALDRLNQYFSEGPAKGRTDQHTFGFIAGLAEQDLKIAIKHAYRNPDVFSFSIMALRAFLKEEMDDSHDSVVEACRSIKHGMQRADKNHQFTKEDKAPFSANLQVQILFRTIKGSSLFSGPELLSINDALSNLPRPHKFGFKPLEFFHHDKFDAALESITLHRTTENLISPAHSVESIRPKSL